MTTQSKPVSKTSSFAAVFLIEMWERFGYYGMQALIIYYMVQRLGFPDTQANLTWSAAAALIYVSPAIGGWVGDKYFGSRHTMLLGTFVLAFGYALMVVPAQSANFLYIALGVIVVGNGLFKANAGNLVRKIYEGDNTKIDSAFTIYYMAVNMGSMFSMIMTPSIKNYFNAPFNGQLTWLLGDNASALFGVGLGWHMAFAVCCVGLLVGFGNYMVMRQTLQHIGTEPDHEPMQLKKLLMVLAGGVVVMLASAVILRYGTVAKIFVYTAGAAVLGIFTYLITKSHSREKPGLIIALILVLETVFFFIFYQQMSTSLNLFALRNVNPSFDLFGWHLWNWDPAQFQAFNPIWIFILSPILAIAYAKLAKHDKDFSIAAKFAFGFLAVAIGFFIYSAAGNFLSGVGRTSSWTMVWGYGFASLGELFTSALGLAFVARYVPARMGGFMMGAYFVASGVAQYLGGIVASFASIPTKITGFAHSPAVTTEAVIRDKLPGVLTMDLGSFRDWITGTGKAAETATSAHVPTFADLPQATQQVVQQFNDQLNMATMPYYTNLFFWLGVAGVACTIIALLVLPLLKRLDKQHFQHMATNDLPLPTVGSEQ